MSAPVDKRKNIASIQFLRFVAATIVVVFHTTQAVDKYFGHGLAAIFVHLADLGAAGVHIFFVISGFIMVYTSFPLASRSFSSSEFLTRRFIRIYPIYFIYAALYLAFYQFIGFGKHLSLGQLVGSILLWPGYSSYIIGPGWTLSYEVYFYACFGLVMTLGLRRGLQALTIVFLAAIASSLFFDTSGPTVHVLTNALLIEFLLGAWAGYLTVTAVPVGNRQANAMLVFALLGFLAGPVCGYRVLPSVLMWGIPSVLLVAGLVFRERNGRVPGIIRGMSFLGDSSYSLYLLHIMLVDLLTLVPISYSPWFKSHIAQVGSVTLALICFAIAIFCIGVAFLAYELVERRVVAFLHSVFRRKVPAASRF